MCSSRGLIVMKNVAKVLDAYNEVRLMDRFSLTKITDSQHAPVYSVDIKRSFSINKKHLNGSSYQHDTREQKKI